MHGWVPWGSQGRAVSCRGSPHLGPVAPLYTEMGLEHADPLWCSLCEGEGEYLKVIKSCQLTSGTSCPTGWVKPSSCNVFFLTCALFNLTHRFFKKKIPSCCSSFPLIWAVTFLLQPCSKLLSGAAPLLCALPTRHGQIFS